MCTHSLGFFVRNFTWRVQFSTFTNKRTTSLPGGRETGVYCVFLAYSGIMRLPMSTFDDVMVILEVRKSIVIISSNISNKLLDCN